MSRCVDALVGNPLSVEQLRLWRFLLDCPAQSFRSYAIAGASADLELTRLRQAFETVCQDYDLLRSRLMHIPGIVYPLLMEGSPLVAYRDLGYFSGDADVAIDSMAHELASCSFVLEESSLIHLHFGRLEPRGLLLGLAVPAFLADGLSLHRVLQKFCSVLARTVGGAASSREFSAVPYGSIRRWREQIVAAEEAKIGKLLWRERLAACEPASWDTIVAGAGAGPSRLAHPGIEQSGGESGIQRIAARIPGNAVAQFAGVDRRAAQSCFFAAWYFLLWKLCNCPTGDFHVAAQFDGRTLEDLVGAIGPLERFLPLGVAVHPGQSFRKLCDDLGAQFEQANEWQDCFTWSSFADLEDFDAMIRSYDYCFEFFTKDAPVAAGSSAPFELLRRFSRSERFKLKLDIAYSDADDSQISLYYDPHHFSQCIAQELLATYRHYLEQAGNDPDMRLRDMEWSAAGRAGKEADAQAPLCESHAGSVSDRFSRAAAQYPDRIALAGNGQSLSYARTAECTAALALLIGNSSLAPESCIAVIGETSFATIIGLIAVLEAGHYFVHIDPEHPPARTLRVLRECGAGLLLHDSATSASNVHALALELGMEDGAVIAITESPSAFERTGTLRRPGGHCTHPDRLAYAAYTSGSTGDPNGVMISQGSLSNQIAWLVESLEFSSDDSWLLKTPLGFDASIWEWLTPLCSGAKLVFGGPRLHLQPDRIAQSIRDHRVTVLQVVPNLIRTLLGEAQQEELESLRYLFVGGEELPTDVCLTLNRRPQLKLINLYGPTETTINATWWSAPHDLTSSDATSIGRAVAGMHAYVLDKLGQLLPRHFVGELHLAGGGLARGYMRKPGATAEKFVPTRFGVGQRMYRTGDLASRDEQGNLFYWGRLDNQVKLRGYRIELGEIEAILVAHGMVKTAAACICAAAGRAGSAQLIAYAVPKDSVARPGAEELREYLRGRVPEYMVPASIVVLDDLPLSSSGKVDRKLLASEEFIDLYRCDSYIAPQTNTQKTLCAIWQQILEVDAVGIGDGFLQLGGQSLLVTRLVASIRQSLAIDISPRLVFDFPVLRDFAEQIDKALEPQLPGI